MLHAKHDGVLPPGGILDTESDGVGVMNAVVDIGKARILDDVSVRAPKGSCLVILGPSGCGKTTLLRTIAGLQPISAGEIFLCGEQVSGGQVEIPPEHRNVGMVFQDWALFPHLTVIENIVFGLPREERKNLTNDVMELLDMAGIADLADRVPSSLSGGQKQRVALARALAPKPKVLLLDEPISSLDTGLRLEVRSEVAALLRSLDVTSIFVTHDQDEAFSLGDQVAVMDDGKVVQQDTPSEIYRHPINRWVAGFVGKANTVSGVASGEKAETVFGSINLCHDAHGDVDVLVRPEEISLCPGGMATVTDVDFYGHDSLYVLQSNDGEELLCRSAGAPDYRIGDRVDIQHSGATSVSFPKI